MTVKQEKPKLSGFLLERNNCISGVRSRNPGLWNPPISMCGSEEIRLQVFTQNLRLRNERSLSEMRGRACPSMAGVLQNGQSFGFEGKFIENAKE